MEGAAVIHKKPWHCDTNARFTFLTVSPFYMQCHICFSKTRMHSSTMRTGRSLTICRSLLRGGVSAPRGCPLPGVCVCSWGVSALGGAVCSWGVSAVGGSAPRGHVCSGGVSALGGGRCLLPWGVCSQGVCLLLGGGVCVSALGGVCSWGCSIPAYTEADTPL